MASTTGNSLAVGAPPADTSAVGAITPGQVATTASAAEYPPLSHAYWALFLFALSLVVNFLDRGILNLLVEPIKRDLHLSDIQVSYLMGFAFVAFYVVLGLPIARLADSGNRRRIMAFGLACWSAMTALCGIAQNFASFFIFRVGVGVGEACTGPSTMSMLSDFFPRHKLPRAIAFMQMGAVVGGGLALIIGSGVIQLVSGVPNFTLPFIGVVHNWQLVFFIVGFPGLIVAALMLTVVEPPRRGRMTKSDPKKGVPILDVAQFIGSHWKTYVPILLGLALRSAYGGGALAWAVVFYQRSFGWSAQRAGLALGILAMAATPVGLLIGSRLAEWYHKRGFDDANMRVVCWVALVTIPLAVIWPLMPTPELALGFALFSALIGAMANPTEFAAIQAVTPNEMRGQVNALNLMVINIIGTGLGPTFIALFTDLVFHNEGALRYSMSLSAAIVGPIAALTFWLGIKHYERSVAAAKAWD
ncbi:MAG: MFS transporter [Alphaproteobacteria bacterium]